MIKAWSILLLRKYCRAFRLIGITQNTIFSQVGHQRTFSYKGQDKRSHSRHSAIALPAKQQQYTRMPLQVVHNMPDHSARHDRKLPWTELTLGNVEPAGLLAPEARLLVCSRGGGRGLRAAPAVRVLQSPGRPHPVRRRELSQLFCR